MAVPGRPESFADGFPQELSVSFPVLRSSSVGNPGISVECVERPLHTYCRHPSLVPANGRSVPEAVFADFKTYALCQPLCEAQQVFHSPSGLTPPKIGHAVSFAYVRK
jgi:hypothetical protein